MRTKLRSKVTLLFVVCAVFVAIPAVAALADTLIITNDVALNTNATKNPGDTGTANVRLDVTNGTPTGDETGCNANGSNPLTVDLKSNNPDVTFPNGDTASITGCGVAVPVSYAVDANSNGGTAVISVDTYSGGRTDGTRLYQATDTMTVTINDTKKPTVTAVTPTGNSELITTNATATFSEAMKASTIDGSSFQLTKPDGPDADTNPDVVPAAVSYATATNKATLDPTANLDYSTTYTATVTTAAQDSAGNALAAVKTWTFTTEPPPNAAPTVSTDAQATSGNEGSELTNSGAFSDADGNSTLTITKQSGAGTVTDNGDGTWDWSHTPNDNGSGTVVVQASDGIAPAVTDSFDWSASNVAPTATKAFDASVDEGSSFNLALNSPSDPSSADTTAGFEYRFDCGTASGFGAWGTASSTSCATTDNGTRNVKAEIRDKDLTPVSTYTGSVTVNNVPPTATFEYPSGTVDEGSSFNLKLTNPSDPSSADTTAGFTYAFDCGDGSGFVADPNSDGVFSCSTNDNGSRTVRGKITDKDNGSTTYPTSGTVSVTVNNVDPTGTLGNNGPKAEGSAATVSFSNPSDASSVDAASLHYAFDCQGGSLSSVTYATASTTNSKSCTFNDNGSYNVTGVIIDKDGGRHSASTTVTVTNADPVVGALSVTSSTNGVACLGGNTATLENFSFTDAGSADTHKAVINWGDGNTQTVDPAVSPEEDLQHTYSGLGPYTITVTVTDDDGGSGSANNNANPVSFHYNIGTTLLSPVNADSSSIFKLGSTIPLKVNITDCNGVGVSGLSPDIRMIKTSSSAPLMGVDEGISTQPNDANWVMRDNGNGQYIYNLASKSLPDSTATYKAVITHNGYSVTSQNYFGLKTK